MIIMDNYETPFWLYEKICQDFNVYPRLDVSATKENRKCKEYFDHDALNQEWDKDFFMNLFVGIKEKESRQRKRKE
jgi:hypothetical protein